MKTFSYPLPWPKVSEGEGEKRTGDESEFIMNFHDE
jgi:hypothetical protein